CAFQVPRIINQFKEEATHVQANTLEIPIGTFVIQSIGNAENRNDFGLVSLTLDGYSGDSLSLQQNFRSNGRNYEDALKNAAEVRYGYAMEDSVFVFNRFLEFSPEARFRGQRLNQTLEIPLNQPFVMDKS